MSQTEVWPFWLLRERQRAEAKLAFWKWEPPGITCKVSISGYLSWRAWIMHDHFDMNLIFATCQTCCMFDWSSTLKVWRVHQEVRMFSQWIAICRKHSPHSWNIMKSNAWTWKCFLSPESPLQTRALLWPLFSSGSPKMRTQVTRLTI